MNLTLRWCGSERLRRLGQREQRTPSVPNCVYLIRAEERYGNGDHIYTLAEQLNASNALYYANQAAPTFFYGAGNSSYGSAWSSLSNVVHSGSAEPYAGSVGPGCASTLRGQQ